MQEPVCFVEFKLVPISAIHAKFDEIKMGYVNPFISKDDKGDVED